MSNYIDEKGNYINNENLSLAEIFYKGMEAGRKAAEQAGVIADIAVWKEPSVSKTMLDIVVCSKCCRAELRKDATEMNYCPGCGRKIVAEVPDNIEFNKFEAEPKPDDTEEGKVYCAYRGCGLECEHSSKNAPKDEIVPYCGFPECENYQAFVDAAFRQARKDGEDEAKRDAHSLDDGDNCLAYKGG